MLPCSQVLRSPPRGLFSARDNFPSLGYGQAWLRFTTSSLFLLPCFFWPPSPPARAISPVARAAANCGARQRDLGTLRAMSWQEFEQLAGETFRRLGYQVRETGGGGADGGSDLILSKKDRRIVVQCKHYKRRSVGVPIVREIVGVAIHEKAQGAFVVTTGSFTKAAQTYALGKPLTLIDGPALLQLIEQGREKRSS
jgi:restriction system protein